jgi:hypothetical protein
MDRESDKRTWREKIHPLFVEVAQLFREDEEAERRGEPADRRRQRVRERLAELSSKYPTLPDTGRTQPLEVIHNEPSSYQDPTEEDLAFGLLEYIHWRKFREPLSHAFKRADSGDLDAYRRVERTRQEAYRLRHRLGGIPAAKEHPQHAPLLSMGMELGLECLTAEELADCFDEICPCGKVHDPEALKKQRSRLRQAVQSHKTR